MTFDEMVRFAEACYRGTGNDRCTCGRQRPCLFHKYRCGGCDIDVINMGAHLEAGCPGKKAA